MRAAAAHTAAHTNAACAQSPSHAPTRTSSAARLARLGPIPDAGQFQGADPDVNAHLSVKVFSVSRDRRRRRAAQAGGTAPFRGVFLAGATAEDEKQSEG